MGKPKRRKSDRAGRPRMYSRGRPTAGRREHRQRFWAAIADGVSSVDAAAEAGVSAVVGVWWFREAGGMRPSAIRASLLGRYLSFLEREEIAVLRSRLWRARDCASARSVPVDDLERAAPEPPRPVVAVWSTGRRLRSGMPIGGRAVRRLPSWP